jgi:hypothetical protein
MAARPIIPPHGNKTKKPIVVLLGKGPSVINETLT